jgi:hypothetical protein
MLSICILLVGNNAMRPNGLSLNNIDPRLEQLYLDLLGLYYVTLGPRSQPPKIITHSEPSVDRYVYSGKRNLVSYILAL